MPIRYFSTLVVKARGRRARPLGARQLEALQDRMSKVFAFSFAEGMRRLKRNVSADALEQAVRSKDYKKLIEQVPLQDTEAYLRPAIDSLGKTIRTSAGAARADLPEDIDRSLRLDTQNKAVDRYLRTRTGAMIENVSDDLQETVQQAVRGAFTQGMSPRQVATQIRDTIGMNSRQAQQYQNFQGSDEDKAALKKRLEDYRAMMVARTEIAYAANQGQLAVWNAAQEQGLIPGDAQKVWAVDGRPCPKICDPMDGVQVALDDVFTLPDGVTVNAPPAHPHCRCRMQLNIGDNPDSGRENYKDGADQAGEDDKMDIDLDDEE